MSDFDAIYLWNRRKTKLIENRETEPTTVV